MGFYFYYMVRFNQKNGIIISELINPDRDTKSVLLKVSF
jgi:hypothetical protein